MTDERLQQACANIAAMSEDDFYAACVAAGITYHPASPAYHMALIEGGRR